jgi:hypothetical protein
LAASGTAYGWQPRHRRGLPSALSPSSSCPSVGMIRRVIYRSSPRASTRRFSRAQKATILARAGGRCEHHAWILGRCNVTEALEADHVHPTAEAAGPMSPTDKLCASRIIDRSERRSPTAGSYADWKSSAPTTSRAASPEPLSGVRHLPEATTRSRDTESYSGTDARSGAVDHLTRPTGLAPNPSDRGEPPAPATARTNCSGATTPPPVRNLTSAHRPARRNSARITANVINPGPIDTGWMTREQVIEVTERNPRGRPGRPTDTAALVSFLCSPDGEWINGQLLHSDGGLGC